MEIVTDAILARRDVEGAVAEFGCFKGGSTAKLSLVCASVQKRLLVFDSFEGLPTPEDWDAEHQIERVRTFKRGEYAGTLDEVKVNVAAHGRIDVCTFVPGWFDQSLQQLDEPIAVAFVDVDLALSTRQVLERLWPLVQPGGIVFVHDATDDKLQDVLSDESLVPGARGRFVPSRDDLPALESKTLAWLER